MPSPSQDDLMGGLSVIMKREETSSVSNQAVIDASVYMLEVDKDASEDDLVGAVKRFQAMVKISNVLGTVTDSEALLEKIMSSIFDIFPQADRSFIMLYRADDGKLKPVAGHRRDQGLLGDEEFEVSQTILNRVAENKQSILSTNALQDDRFAGGQSIADFSIRSLMYVPFVHKDEILGVITVDTTSADRAFNKDDLEMLTGIAAQAAVSLKNVELYKEIQQETQSRTQLSRYLSPDIVEGILAGTIPLRLGVEEKYGTVLFCDIIGFTAMSESMSAVDVINKLNRYFLLVTDVVTRNSGTLHKFEGDMVMAFWNVMFGDENAECNAVRTGIEMQLAVWQFGLELEAEGQTPIHLGVGCNTGAFAGGNIGGNDKMEYTVIGDNINLGKRIESQSGRWQVFVSESTYLPLREKSIAVGLPPTMVKGKAEPVEMYSIRGLQISDADLLLCIPVSIRDREDKFIQRGILAGGRETKDSLAVMLLTSCKVEKGDELVMRFNIPEIDAIHQLTGQVVSVNEKSNNGTHVFSNCIVSNITTDQDTENFLKPGYCAESDKSWEDMKRK
ncbi:MAG: GAF domain-containing protein [bacterium]|nr:GAF domain-containing protein [bacterium]